MTERGRVKGVAVLLAMYALGAPLFAFLAWAFSDAAHVGDLDDRHVRRLLSGVTGVLWPVLLVGIVQMLGLWLLATLSQSRRLQPADR